LEALAAYERLGDRWGEAAALNALGWLYTVQDRFDGNEALFERTLSVSKAAGDVQFSAMAEVNLAEQRLHLGDVEGATILFAACVDRHRSLRLMYSVAYLLEAVARLAAGVGDPERATRLAGAASGLRETAGVAVWGTQLDRRNRFFDQLRTALGADQFAEAFAAGSRLSYADALDETGLPR
jgi:tetratricopeptide (TPR) repeat protein